MVTAEFKRNENTISMCSGKWMLNINGVTLQLPATEMDTFGEYDRWGFDDSGHEDWEKYEDGLPKDKWVETPPEFLIAALKNVGIEVTQELLGELFDAISPQDWRHLSCGACI